MALLESKIAQFSGGNSSVSKKRGQPLIEVIYKQGTELIRELLHYSKLDVDSLLEESVKLDIQVYQDTVLTFDYPTYNPICKQQGIELFLNYVHAIRLENDFMRLFDTALIIEMFGYYNNGYCYLIFNVPKLLLKQLLLKLISGSDFSFFISNTMEIRTSYLSF